VGFSNGASTALALLQSFPDDLRGIVAFAATITMDAPTGAASLVGKTVFLANGLTDDYTPEVQTKAIMKQLADAGAVVTLFTHPGGHSIVMPHVQQIRNLLS
jgi:predicted esterase